MFKKTMLRLICIAVTFCMAVGVNPYVSASDAADTVQIAVLKNDIIRGDQLNEESVEFLTVKSQNLPENVIKDTSEVYGKYAEENMYAGDYIYKNQLSDTPIKISDSELIVQQIKKTENDFLVVTDFVKANTGADITRYLQAIITQNGGRTVYFPDGEYVISRPLIFSAVAAKSTTVYMSGGAVLKASDDWQASNELNAMICIGGDFDGKNHVNDNRSNGSYFGVFGGTFDCNNKADGIAIVSSRESVIYGSNIKNPNIGIQIYKGANGTSSDADLENITITGCNKEGSVGVLITGADNNLTDIKIYDMEIGVSTTAASYACQNVQCIRTDKYADAENYNKTIGFYGHGKLLNCYVENYATAYCMLVADVTMINLKARWTHDAKTQVAFYFKSGCSSRLAHCFAEFYGTTGERAFFKYYGWYGPLARLDSPILNAKYENYEIYKQILDVSKNGIIDFADD